MDQGILSKISQRSYFRSSSFVMALLFTIILGSATGILGYTGYYLNRNHFISGIEQLLDTEDSYLNSSQANNCLMVTLDQRLQDKKRVYFLVDKDGHKIAGNLNQMPEKIVTLKGELIYFTPEGREKIFAAKIYPTATGGKMLIGTDMSYLRTGEHMILWLGGAAILLMMSVVIVSYLISTFVVARTNHIAQTAQDIMATGDLSRRITIDSQWDDLSKMAFVLNNLLARVDVLMTGIKRVADNIAHDLRTPLTRLRNNLEDISKEETYSAQKISNIIKDTDHILSTFQAVLRISKIENAASKEHFKSCDLSVVLKDVLELYEPVSLEKQINIRFSIIDHALYEGDVNLLFQMIANLLDNAIKFTPPAGGIHVQLLRTENGKYQITIEDGGEGIPEADLQYVFDRFFRSEKSRSTNGNGLGLSLVMAVLNLHDGQISLENLDKGLRVSIIL